MNLKQKNIFTAVVLFAVAVVIYVLVAVNAMSQ